MFVYFFLFQEYILDQIMNNYGSGSLDIPFLHSILEAFKPLTQYNKGIEWIRNKRKLFFSLTDFTIMEYFF